MPITFTGRSVKPGGNVYPSLVDIAVGLSRQPRFAGQGRRWFSVLDHSLFADEMVQRTPSVPVIAGDDEEGRKHWRLAALLHDAHEAITGDVPTTFKGDELRRAQDGLDAIIGLAYYPVKPYSEYARHFMHPDVRNAVKWIDRRALAAEARVIGPQMVPERALEAFGVTDDTPQDIELLEMMLKHQDWIGAPPFRDAPQDVHPGVEEYLRRVMELM